MQVIIRMGAKKVDLFKTVNDLYTLPDIRFLHHWVNEYYWTAMESRTTMNRYFKLGIKFWFN